MLIHQVLCLKNHGAAITTPVLFCSVRTEKEQRRASMQGNRRSAQALEKLVSKNGLEHQLYDLLHSLRLIYVMGGYVLFSQV